MAASDRRARDTLREVALELATLLADSKDIDAALPFFREAIVQRPERAKDKKITSRACYFLSWRLLRSGRRSEAKRYFRLGQKVLLPGKLKEQYNTLRSELFEQRLIGRLLSVIEPKGYGFIEREDAPGQTIFVHITQVVPRVSGEEFKSMQGGRVSFTIEETEKGPEARNVKLLEG